MNLPDRATYFTLQFYWWKNPPEWHAFLTITDEHRQRVKPFTSKALDPTTATDEVITLAANYTFPAIVETFAPKLELNLELDL